MSRRAAWIALAWLHAFNALSALGGGAVFLWRPDGSGMQADMAMLRYTPFPDFFIPGLVLFTAVGCANLVAAVVAIRRPPWAWMSSMAVGLTLVGFIVGEHLLLREFHWLQGLYFSTGLIAAIAAWRLRPAGP